MNAHSAWLLSRFVCISTLLICGTQIAAASVPAVVADGQIALASGLSFAQGVAVSPTGTIYVADTGNNRVVTISNTGVATPVSTPGFTLSSPGGVAVDASGNLYIADSYNARVLKVPTSGSPTAIAGAPNLSLPIAVTVDTSGNVYIGDANNAAVYEVPFGGSVKKINLPNNTNLFPQALAADGLGNVYIADNNSNFIYELAPGGSTLQNVTPGGFTLSSPSGLAFDAAGNLFVLDSGNSRVVEVPHGDPTHPYQVPITGLAIASGMALDPAGNLYVTDYSSSSMTQLVYSGNAINLGQVAVGSTGPAVAVNYELNAPETLTAFKVTMQGDPGQEGSIGAGTTCQFQSYTNSPPTSGNPISPSNPFVCMANLQGVPGLPGVRNGALLLLGPSNVILSSLPFMEIGTAAGAAIFPGIISTTTADPTSGEPQGIAISAQGGTVYVADAYYNQVYSWKGLNGGPPGRVPVNTAPITLVSPYDVALNGAGDLFIADGGAGKVIVVPANPAIAPHPLDTGTLLHFPWALTFDAIGNLYIGDLGPLGLDVTPAQPGQVVKVPASGSGASVLNTSPVTIVAPSNLTTDPIGNVYVTDIGDTSGSVVLLPQGGGVPSVLNLPGVTLPNAIATDPAGQLYVLDPFSPNQLTVLRPDHTTSYIVPIEDTGINNPVNMVLTSDGRNFVIADIAAESVFQLNVSQAQLTFPTTAVTTPPTSSPSQNAYIVSTGNAPLKSPSSGNAYYETGSISEFQVQSAAICSGITQLQPAQYCTQAASFAPAYEGMQSLLLTSIFNSSNQVQLLLTGTTPNASSVTASPTFAPGSGTFVASQVVTISATAGAVIHYSIDGSTPTTSSPVYSNPVRVSDTTTINAIAVASGSTASPVATATYAFNPYLGDNDYSYAGTDYANYINATYAVTGNDSGGYTVTSCSFYQPSGTVTAGAKMDCGLILAPTPTTKASSWLCHATYTNPGPSGAGGWVTLALSGCGTLPHGTAYWIATDSNDPIQGFPYGFSTCGGSCNGSAPTVGNGTYPYRYIAATYGQYTGLNSSMTATTDGHQASQFVTLGLNTPFQTATPTFSIGSGTYSTAQTVSISDATSGAVIYYTTDGSTPTTSSPVYHSAITVTTTTTINVLAVAPGYTNSAIATATYTFNPYLGTNAYSTAGTDYANYINATYAVTGSNAHGYTVSSCSFFQPTGTVTSGAKVDCGVILAPTATTQSSSWLCHGTYTNPTAQGAGAWITVALSGCGTLPASTAYWIATDSNDTHQAFPYGFWNCGSSCNGSAPTIGTGTYGYRYISASYGQYTGMGTSMLAGGNQQASQFVGLAVVP